MFNKIPTTVITGFLGAGKTTLIRHLINNAAGRKIALIINEFGDLGVDGDILKGCGVESCNEEDILELSNGCICCTLREDLLLEINKLAKDNKFDYLVIESTGISEPLPVAETFTFADEDGSSLSDVAKLDTMVTVVDAVNFLKDYDEAKYLKDTGESLGEEDERSVADLLVDQIEFADVILISKSDLVTNNQIDRLKAILVTLNTHAKIIPISNGKVNVDNVLNTNLFDFEKAQQAPGWLKEMRGEHVPETEEYGISSFSYVARRPFDPEKFYNFLHDTKKFGKLIRSKGYFWLCTRPEFVGQWSQAGGIASYGFAGMFWKSIPKKDWPTDEASLAFINKQWVEPFGDMRQELVFIGQKVDKKSMTSALDECLLSDEDLLKGKSYWATLNDPFPAWEETTS